MTEVWKVCQEWPEVEVSNLGGVRTSRNKKLRYKYINKQGYFITQVKRQGKVYTLKLHRLIAEAFLEPPPQELIDKCSKEHWGVVLVNHKDGVKLNNVPENLEWCDMNGNNTHAMSTGLTPALVGEMQGRATLTDNRVHELCAAFEAGMMPKDAVEVFGVSRAQATKIRAGFAWTHISSQYNISVNKRRIPFND